MRLRPRCWTGSLTTTSTRPRTVLQLPHLGLCSWGVAARGDSRATKTEVHVAIASWRSARHLSLGSPSGSPTASAPLPEVWPLSAEGAVVPVPRVEPRGVVEPPEDPYLEVVHQRVE